MMEPVFARADLTIYQGDCRAVMAALPAASVDAVVCDPPYSLGFMGRDWDSHAQGEDAAFGYYLAGLVDGEGHFRVQEHARGSYSCACSIKMRADDEAILRQAQRFLGVGTITREPKEPHNMVKLTVQAKADCLRVMEVFCRYPLRAKKLRDFLAWADAVVEWNDMARGNRWTGPADWSRLGRLKEAVERAREYREVAWSGHPFQDWSREWAEGALRVLKPGGHLVAFGGTRTYHRLTCALEDAGFEIRDCLMWLYGSGFPKSLDVSKAIDKAAGATREKVTIPADQVRNPKVVHGGHGIAGGDRPFMQAARESGYHEMDGPDPITDAARTWQGWGTALKPAWEPIVLARKPLGEANVAANVLRHGTGALNVDGCRIGTEPRINQAGSLGANGIYGRRDRVERDTQTIGRWPANVVLDEAAAARLDAQSGERPAGVAVRHRSGGKTFGGDTLKPPMADVSYGDTGGASRFFYTAKADREDRDGSKHPTVKPQDLMRWLIRLVAPPGATLLDPFLGSGSTLAAARSLGDYHAIGIEQDAGHVAEAIHRFRQEVLF